MADWDNILTRNTIPPEPGTVGVPPGHARVWHYSNVDSEPGDTRPWHEVVNARAASLRRHGVNPNFSRTGTYGEPEGMVWAAASATPPDNIRDKIYVEAHVNPKTDIDIGRGRSASELEAYGSHVTTFKPISPHQFTAVHEPWHAAARYIMGDPRTLETARSGGYDSVAESHPLDYGPAIAYAKSIRPQFGPRREATEK